MIRILACAISSASHIVFWFIIQFLEILNGYFRNIVYDSTCKAKTGNASQKTGWWRFPEQTPPFHNRFFILPLYVEKPFTVTLKPLRQSESLWRAFPGCMHFHVIAEDVPCVLSTQTNTRAFISRFYSHWCRWMYCLCYIRSLYDALCKISCGLKKHKGLNQVCICHRVCITNIRDFLRSLHLEFNISVGLYIRNSFDAGLLCQDARCKIHDLACHDPGIFAIYFSKEYMALNCIDSRQEILIVIRSDSSPPHDTKTALNGI